MKTKRRYTREEIADKARDHVAYGWTRSPGTHRDDIEWTAEDTQIYNEEYEKAKKEQI
jgi:hypothetical protein